jgi:hypothetical protein
MNRKWRYFVGAAALAAYFLIAQGAPPIAVAAGIAGAAMFMRRTSRAF